MDTVTASTRASAVNPIPEGMHSITPMLICENASAAIDWYVRALGAVELSRLPGPDGKLMHAQLRIGDSHLMLTDECPAHGAFGPGALKGSPITLHLYVEDVDSAFARAVEAGATVRMPVTDMFWGDRYGLLADPFGHAWSLATHLQDLTPEQIRANFDKMCG